MVLCLPFRIESEFRNIGFWGGGKIIIPVLKPLGVRATTTSSAHMWCHLWDLNPSHIGERLVLSPLYWSPTQFKGVSNVYKSSSGLYTRKCYSVFLLLWRYAWTVFYFWFWLALYSEKNRDSWYTLQVKNGTVCWSGKCFKLGMIICRVGFELPGGVFRKRSWMLYKMGDQLYSNLATIRVSSTVITSLAWVIILKHLKLSWDWGKPSKYYLDESGKYWKCSAPHQRLWII